MNPPLITPYVMPPLNHNPDRCLCGLCFARRFCIIFNAQMQNYEDGPVELLPARQGAAPEGVSSEASAQEGALENTSKGWWFSRIERRDADPLTKEIAEILKDTEDHEDLEEEKGGEE